MSSCSRSSTMSLMLLSDCDESSCVYEVAAARMAAASGLAVTVDLALIPLSKAYRAQCGDDRAARLAAATAGDDYQLLFAAAPDTPLPVAAQVIGRFAGGAGLSLIEGGAPVTVPDRLGFEHRC